MDNTANWITRIRETRQRLVEHGPPRTRAVEGDDFTRVTLPEVDCDLLRDALIAENPSTVVEIGLAYARSALAIGEALVSVDSARGRHIVIDPGQQSAYLDAGWEVLCDAGLDQLCTLYTEPSQIVLPRLVTEERVADAAFVDGSHHFHNVFVDLYFLRRIVRPGGLIVLDDHWTPSVASAAKYYESNLGWQSVPELFEAGTARKTTEEPRVRAYRLPDPPTEPPFTAFVPF